MAAETTVHFPLHFLAIEEVRSFIFLMRGENSLTATAAAFLLVMDFGGQGRDWRPLKKPVANGTVNWIEEPLGITIAHAAGHQHLYERFMKAALESGLLVLEMRGDIAGLTCPIFQRYNEHLLPGYIPFHKKGQLAAQRKKEAERDPELARAQLRLLQTQQTLNLGELSADTTDAEIESAIVVIMQMDRAGGLPPRGSSGYASWMIAAITRMMRQRTPEEVRRLIEFLVEARIDPTVPKGAEAVITKLGELLERSSH